MKRRRSGFTLIEVSLFLAITGLLFVGIAIGTQNSIFQQRFNDSVQGFAEFLRSEYSEVTNVRNDGEGRSDQAIYGKLITFGEGYDLAGQEIDPGSAVFSYNVVGGADADGVGPSDGLLTSLAVGLEANVVVKDEGGIYKPAGFAEDYKPRWSSAIQKVGSADNFVGAILIVRHPDSGTIFTFVKDDGTIQVNETIKSGSEDSLKNLLGTYLTNGSFELEAVDFCVNPNGIDQGGLRRDVRLVKNARNGSGVEVIGDGEDDQCGQVD